MIGDSGRTSASIGRAHRRGGTRYSRKRLVAGMASAVLAATGLAACSSANAGTGPVTLTYYLYPDTSKATSTAISNCDKASGGKYTISYQQLPQAADGQRQQLALEVVHRASTASFLVSRPPGRSEAVRRRRGGGRTEGSVACTGPARFAAAGEGKRYSSSSEAVR